MLILLKLSLPLLPASRYASLNWRTLKKDGVSSCRCRRCTCFDCKWSATFSDGSAAAADESLDGNLETVGDEGLLSLHRARKLRMLRALDRMTAAMEINVERIR